MCVCGGGGGGGADADYEYLAIYPSEHLRHFNL